MSNIAVIPARGGSKRIPRKNVKSFLGKPIIAYSIEAALKSGIFCEVMVSTDDDEIASVAKQYGAVVPFMRSVKNSNDYAGLADVCLEVIDMYIESGKKFDNLCCILPTAPFITDKKLVDAFEKLENDKYNCVYTVEEYSYPIQRSLRIECEYVKMCWPENMSKRSQDLERIYHDAGQFYFIKIDSLFSEKRLFTDKSGAIILCSLEVQDIDTETDWALAEMKYKIITKM